MHFEDTRIAFISKSDRDLQRAYWLFKTISHPWLVKMGTRLVSLAVRWHIPVEWILKPTVYKHFCGGETLKRSLPVVEKMAAHRVKSILDYSVEESESEAGISLALNETLRSIRFAATSPHIPFAVFKPTAFTTSRLLEAAGSKHPLTEEENLEANRLRERIDRLCREAFDHGIPILIDAEESHYQHLIDEVAEEMMKKYNRQKAIVFNTFQMYRTDRLDFLKESYRKARKGSYFLGAKFVRGAYMEKERERAQKMGYPSPIHPDKESTDRDYDAALKFSVEHIDRISIFNGTHNENSSAYMAELMKTHGIPPDDERIWFSQLLGMSDHISFNLAHRGFLVAKYVPYGPVRHVIPYLLRRAEENTSVAGQSNRELDLIVRERNRRKAEK